MLGSIFKEIEGLDDDTILMLFVIYERFINENSFWKPYFGVLPDVFPTALNFGYASPLPSPLPSSPLSSPELRISPWKDPVISHFLPQIEWAYSSVEERLTTNQEVAGSIPAMLESFF